MKSSEYISLKKKEREQTEIPEIEQIVKEVWQWNWKEQSEAPPISHENSERVVSATFDWKTIAIFILSIIIIWALIGYNIHDRGMQENIDKIQRENKIIWTANKQIDNAKITIAKSESNIEKSKKILKDKYHLIYQ